jgi:hypothetical protein
VGVIKVDLPNPAQPRQNPGPLRPEHRAKLVIADREVPVGALLGGVDQGVVGAVRRSQDEFVAADGHGRKHVGGELVPMPGLLVQGALAEDGRVDPLAAVGAGDVTREGLQFVSDGGPAWQPQR